MLTLYPRELPRVKIISLKFINLIIHPYSNHIKKEKENHDFCDRSYTYPKQCGVSIT